METLQCPRCKAKAPRGDWSTRYGVITCGTCLHSGYVILPETVMKKVSVGLHVDEFATMDSSPEEEYAEIEEAIREAVPGVEFNFIRDMPPHKLSQTSVNVYLFDIGGLCRVDWNGERREEYCRTVNKLADERPNTLFVPWSSMTRNYLRSAIRMLQPQWDDGDTLTTEIPLGDRPNVALPHDSEEEKLFQYGPQEHYTAVIKRWIELS